MVPAGAFGLMLVLNIMVSLEFDKDKVVPSITLIELGNKAMAQGDSGGVDNCLGGSCTYTHYFAEKRQWECSSCCPAGKTPQCNSGGCTCW
ncbi:hypothetical protein [Arthrospiribacter ruber]|uniref:Uncharacterized protein n=1 Tax=Arthrospiribacter ruber TaxID=2487934 RepID=A0A951IVH7_9BACT|nr:hypothetical protein [Arthrospiribacter ruber]MBW3466964.1 hypothetical protein [Arthrospiribacter ruber]